MFQEEVWEVAAQLLGLGLGILFLVSYFVSDDLYSLESNLNLAVTSFFFLMYLNDLES